MKTVDSYNFSGKKALIRVDYNVPLNEELEITDDTRIRATIPTIQKVLADGGRVILMSHLGRPKNGPEDKFSLKHLLPALQAHLGVPISFSNDCVGETAIAAANDLKDGEVLLLENLRFHPEETKGDEIFAGQLASLGDVYVNDAFGTAHRAHASTAIIAQHFPNDKVFGYVMANEIKNIEKVLHESEAPFVAIIGGAKVSSKISIIHNLLDRIDKLIIGGGMAYTFIKAMGGEVGNSLVEDDCLDMARDIILSTQEKDVELYLPVDTLIANEFSNDVVFKTCPVDEIPANWMGLDIGPNTVITYISAIEQCKTILWNGPMGVFEMSNFANGTHAIATAVASATERGAYSLVGGGDSVAAVNQLGFTSKVSYVSTGGGALLEYMEGKTLPGISAILN